jgi:FixJ family two-component response regulator
MKILIVDDEAHIRQMMRLTLQAAGYETAEAANADDGLAMFGDGGGFAAVLLDQKMPGLDGLETLREIKKREREACVVMVTAFASIELAVDAMRLGATDFLRKPMTPEMLRGAVAAALAIRPRVPLKHPGSVEPPAPHIETLTLNGFRIVRPRGVPEPPESTKGEHIFAVTHFPDGTTTQVIVCIDPAAVARVVRLTRHPLQPGGAFWREQAERALSAYLWSEGQVPEGGRLTVRDVSRDDIDVAAAWDRD